MEFFSRINQDLFLQIFHIARQNSLLDFMMIFGADYLIFIVLIFVLFLLFKNRKNRQNFFLLIISLTIGGIASSLLHIFFYEPRPFLTYHIIPLVYQPNNGSFPSFHTTILTILAFSFIKTNHKYKQMMLVPIIWTGFARIYTGVHFPLDILGGFIVGALSVFIAAKFFQKVRHL